jgi:hypothetical protein
MLASSKSRRTALALICIVGFSIAGYTQSGENSTSVTGTVKDPWKGLIVDNGGLGPDGIPVGPADQRSQIKTFNIAPSWTRLINNNTVFTLGAFVRRDQFNYYPSADPFADLAPHLQQKTISQNRTLTNAGIRSNLSYVRGIHNLKAGVTYQHTFLDENDRFGIDPTLNPVCFNTDGSPDTDPTLTDPSLCGGPRNPGGSVNRDFNSLLLSANLTRGGGLRTTRPSPG